MGAGYARAIRRLLTDQQLLERDRRRLPKPAAVVFDLDGTLVDTVAARLRAWLAAFAEFGIPAEERQVAGLIGSDGRRVARVVGESAGRGVDAKLASAIDRRAGEIYDELNTDPRPLPGASELLAALDAGRIPWSIATSSLQAQAKASVDALTLQRRPIIVDGSHVEHAKPAPDLLLRASSELHTGPESIWYVGDSIWDMQAAGSAGMPAIGVTSGYATAEELRGAGGWRVIGRLDELMPLIEAARG